MVRTSNAITGTHSRRLLTALSIIMIRLQTPLRQHNDLKSGSQGQSKRQSQTTTDLKRRKAARLRRIVNRVNSNRSILITLTKGTRRGMRLRTIPTNLRNHLDHAIRILRNRILIGSITRTLTTNLKHRHRTTLLFTNSQLNRVRTGQVRTLQQGERTGAHVLRTAIRPTGRIAGTKIINHKRQNRQRLIVTNLFRALGRQQSSLINQTLTRQTVHRTNLTGAATTNTTTRSLSERTIISRLHVKCTQLQRQVHNTRVLSSTFMSRNQHVLTLAQRNMTVQQTKLIIAGLVRQQRMITNGKYGLLGGLHTQSSFITRTTVRLTNLRRQFLTLTSRSNVRRNHMQLKIMRQKATNSSSKIIFTSINHWRQGTDRVRYLRRIHRHRLIQRVRASSVGQDSQHYALRQRRQGTHLTRNIARVKPQRVTALTKSTLNLIGSIMRSNSTLIKRAGLMRVQMSRTTAMINVKLKGHTPLIVSVTTQLFSLNRRQLGWVGTILVQGTRQGAPGRQSQVHLSEAP